MGLSSPINIAMKISMKEIVKLKVGWDEEVPTEIKDSWVRMLKELIDSPPLVFPRRIFASPEKDTMPHIELVGYWDGSMDAYCAVIYARSLASTSPPVWSTQLVTAKCRVTPVQGLTIPRSELCGLLALVRLTDTVLRSLADRVRRVTLIGDSSCTIASFDATTTLLAPYFGNRIGECMETIAAWGDLLD